MTRRTALRGLSLACVGIALSTLLSACVGSVRVVGEQDEYEKMMQDELDARAHSRMMRGELQHLSVEDFQNELQLQMLMKDIAAQPGQQREEVLNMLEEVDKQFHAHSGRRDCADCDKKDAISTP